MESGIYLVALSILSSSFLRRRRPWSGYISNCRRRRRHELMIAAPNFGHLSIKLGHMSESKVAVMVGAEQERTLVERVVVVVVVA